MATETILLPKRSTFASASKLAVSIVSRLSDYDERARLDTLPALVHEVSSGHRVFLAIDRQLTDAGTVFIPKLSYRVDPGEPLWREAVEQRFAEAASAHRAAVVYGLWFLWLNLRTRGYTDEDFTNDRPWFDWPQQHPDEGVLTWDDSSIDDPQWNLGGALAENAKVYPFIENYGELIQRIRREAVAVEKLLPEQSDWPPKRMTFAQKTEAFLALTPDSPLVQEFLAARKRKENGAEVAAPKRPAYDRENDDGPVEPNLFQWGGKEYKTRPQLFRLLQLLWHARNRRASANSVIDAVWSGDDPSEKTLANLPGKLTEWFNENKLPFSCDSAAGWFTLNQHPERNS